jgi:hypothetical protein
MKLKSGMECHHRIIGELRGQQIRVHRSRFGRHTPGDDSVDSSADMDQIAPSHMLRQGCLTRQGATSSGARVRLEELLVPEDRVALEEFGGFHDL